MLSSEGKLGKGATLLIPEELMKKMNTEGLVMLNNSPDSPNSSKSNN